MKTKPYPVRSQMISRYKLSAPISFNEYGHLDSGQFPAQCIDDCSASGRVDEAVEYWRKELGLVAALEPRRKLVESYLKEYGAWDDLETADIETLADRVLWTAMCDIKESGDWLGICH